MALVSQSFAERYAELVAHVPTYTELLLDLQRREVGDRKALEEKCQMAFQDVLHVAAVMISDKKALGRGALAHRNLFEVALYKKQTAVWFQAAPPRKVDLPITRPVHGFPHAAFAELCREERELRQWHYGVERRLREHIEEACGRAWFFLNVINDAARSESLSRQRLQYEEDEDFTAIKQRFFRAVPADYYRNVVIARYGQTTYAIEQAKDLPFEEEEEKVRAALMEEEEASWRSAYQYLQDMYDVQLFALNHREVLGRYELEEEERNMLFPLILQCCREDFGIVFYHVPALALHFNSSQPCLRALCVAQMQEAPRRTAATRSRFSWIPAFDVAGMISELGFEEDRGEIAGSAEGETEEAEGRTNGGDDSHNALPPPVDDMPPVNTASTMVFEPELGSTEVPEPETKREESEVDTSPSAVDALDQRTHEESVPSTEMEVAP
ncbi:conserved hypothetical protein [Leishmania infantum JPCM5]|uniref:Uncharacterized protein n=2 Tax=Leishmania infantum TaxID=5671 RepID=A4I812_LEIIN|nr:conserved hypothetical protein [Leishmania infantum JPCM5]CAC9525395.1 hypothetical_protein_-_conserved [Leishmania infantum]CAM70951.1 conserved hypothetical protein [Leishmania infantum JPCM5]SUZ44765.1 hypothetical_protein_-_conserved [Leishmania infantum]|eukprot:XP_001467881.1 conserved hypothetical protein [Leishmania infantum JPCM5]